jgi:magnesium chelatase subunit I
MRRNLIRRLKAKEPLLPGIIGYEKTVLPSLRTRSSRRLHPAGTARPGEAASSARSGFLDDHIPVVEGCRDQRRSLAPLQAVPPAASNGATRSPSAWLDSASWRRPTSRWPISSGTSTRQGRERAPLLSDEEVIHYGLIPRTHRGIFAINELPDLQTRIQVGLLNIMEERDVQIRGFPIRLPLDVCIVYSANPEDYTNRGTIITPLRDRIDSQIMTHYPATLEDGMAITTQESWVERTGAPAAKIPRLLRELVESVAFAARKSTFVDQSSGVSARLTIAALENVVSNAEHRAIANGEATVVPRVCDLYAALPAVTGKIELVYEGEQEGPAAVSRRVLGDAVQQLFSRYFPNATPAKPKSRRPSPEGPMKGSKDTAAEETIYKPVMDWFAKGNKVELTDQMPAADYARALDKVEGLRDLAVRHLRPQGDGETALAMEFTLEGLHQHSLVAREEIDSKVSYRDMLRQMFESL